MPTKNISKWKFWGITEKLMDKLQDMVNQKVKGALKKYQDTTRQDFNKLQSETKKTIKKDT
jgi:hypothetical protein